MKKKLILLFGILMIGFMPLSATNQVIADDTEVITPTPTPIQTVTPTVTPTPRPVKDGLVKEEGYYRYYKKGKLLKSQWKDVDGKRYYFKSDGNGATYSCKIDGQYYVFNERARLVRPVSNKVVAVGDKKYLADSKGRPKTGWNVVKDKLYYVDKTGECVKNKTVDGVTLTKDCWAKNNTNTQLKLLCMKTVKELTTDNMTKSQKLYRCWSYLSGGRFGYVSKYPDLSKTGWHRKTALEMFQRRGGNCYGFACAFAALADEIGYEPVIICGRIKIAYGRDHAADGYTRHCWVMIDGKHYDPEGQFAGWYRGIYGYKSYPLATQIQKKVKY
ncbi:MAG: transglutaminase domain-containing protein [Eubacteriales bacterium]|nr:transglutaminase domain-containing protein [Eubacteriales bacterium]